MRAGENIEFNQSKYFKYIRELGSGGTGVTHLFKDETTDTFFAIKKYQPSGDNLEYKEELYNRFVDEIKILFQLSHPNIVRVYNYYLYPNFTLGYLQMEYIEGVPIDEYVDNNIVDLNILFQSVIDAFVCLENNSILHRDIRPANIMVNNDGEIKVIDFGFGKICQDNDNGNSVRLNWPATEYPNEIQNANVYTNQTEIYFLGYLFRKLIRENVGDDFKFTNILEKMCEPNIELRYESFEEVSADIAEGIFLNMGFTSTEKKTYKIVAESLGEMIIQYTSKFSLITDIDEILRNLENVLKSNILEDYIQNNSMLISAFIKNGYSYNKKIKVSVYAIEKFYKLFFNSDYHRRKIILENLKNRLSLIKNEDIPFDIEDDELPF